MAVLLASGGAGPVPHWRGTLRWSRRCLAKVWELNLETLRLEQTHHRASGLPVFALRFSPDGQHVAVIMDWNELGGESAEVRYLNKKRQIWPKH